jgi:hypothetical protein
VIAEIAQGDWLANAGNRDGAVALEKVQVVVRLQIATANDAIEDWRDIVPEDVAALERLSERRNLEVVK